jgi:regulator of sirC expression with transglutaminase-like and TPR domain
VTSSTRKRFAQVVRAPEVDDALACLLIGGEVEPDLDVDASCGVLDQLAATVELPDATSAGAAAALRRALGVEAGLYGDESDYEDLRSSLLHEVLRRGRGLPITLSLVYREVAARLGVPAVCLGLPGHVMLAVGAPGEQVVVDPFHGGVVRSVEPTPVLEGTDLVLRVLTNIRALTERQARSIESSRTRLWATELTLLLPRHPLSLRRERGELLARLGAFEEGAVELEAYAAVVQEADEAEAQRAWRAARLSRARLN